jgi:uncharacterized membrane protein
MVDDHEHRARLARSHSAFGADRFGRAAEKLARAFGTPQFIIGQTIIVTVWIALNAVAVSLRWDPYPFILLNLAFSTQAAYAAPLILLAQTRQADRDKLAAETALKMSDHQHKHAEAQQAALRQLAQANLDVTEKLATLTEKLEAGLNRPG